MINSIERFAELYDSLGIKFEIMNGILWREYQGMVVPLGPAMFDYTISEDEARFLLSKFPKALLVRWTDGFNLSDDYKGIESKSEEGWYAVICTKFKDLEEYSSSDRNKIKKGLKNCEVKRVEADFIARNGFNIFVSAFERYKGVKKPSITEKEFRERVLKMRDFEDIVHYWGVFHKNNLIAYSENYIYDNIEVGYSTTKFHPDFLKLRPSEALIYEMNKYYLKDHKFKYVNDGFRNILHQTNIQDFLIDKFNFIKAYTNLYVFYRNYVSFYLKMSYPIRKIIKNLFPKVGALYIMEEIIRRQKRYEKWEK
jgi:hypothetical protein